MTNSLALKGPETIRVMALALLLSLSILNVVPEALHSACEQAASFIFSGLVLQVALDRSRNPLTAQQQRKLEAGEHFPGIA